MLETRVAMNYILVRQKFLILHVYFMWWWLKVQDKLWSLSGQFTHSAELNCYTGTHLSPQHCLHNNNHTATTVVSLSYNHYLISQLFSKQQRS